MMIVKSRQNTSSKDELRNILDYIFYVYVYLDPYKPGKYKYGEFEFDYEPFYIGKGSNDRLYVHLAEAKKGYGENQDKIDRINEILAAEFTEEDLKKHIIKYRENMSSSDAYDLEIQMIAIIGRADKGLGPLVNHTDGGDDPPRMDGEKNGMWMKRRELSPLWGRKHTEEQNRNQSERVKGGNHPQARACIAEWKPFPAITIAAKELNITYRKIWSWIHKGKEGYSFVGDTQEDIEARRKANRNKTIKAVTINGMHFPSVKSAFQELNEKLNIDYQTLCGWIRTGKPGYSYVTKENK